MRETTDPTSDTSTEHVTVEIVDGHHGLVATKDFESGDVVLILHGEITSTPSRYSVQIGPDRHIEVPDEVKASGSLDRYRWRFLNHSCAPNAAFEGRALIAAQTIRASEQITFDYNTTEFDLASPFACHCGAKDCCGVVRGARWQKDEAEERAG